jgi:hypothetical protein
MRTVCKAFATPSQHYSDTRAATDICFGGGLCVPGTEISKLVGINRQAGLCVVLLHEGCSLGVSKLLCPVD